MAKLEPTETITGRELNARGDNAVGVLVTLPKEVTVTIDHSALHGRGAEQNFTGRDVILKDLVAVGTGWARWRGSLLDENNQPITEVDADFDVLADDTIEVWA